MENIRKIFLVGLFIIFLSNMSYAGGPLRFAQIVDTPDQVVGAKILVQILDKGRVDVVITARLNGLIQLKRSNLHSIYPIDPPLSKKLVYHYLHKKHKDLVPLIDGVFKEMQKSGELESLREKFTSEMLN